VKVAERAPPGTVTEAGVVALAVLDDSETAVPFGDAVLVRVTVPTDELPPVTFVGDKVRLLRPSVPIAAIAVPAFV